MTGMFRRFLVIFFIILSITFVTPAPHHHHREDGDIEADGWMGQTWSWIKRAGKTVKGWIVGDHSVYNQLMSKLKENRTISVMGNKVTFSLPNNDDVHWGSSISSIFHNLKKEPLLRVVLALYINIVIFIAVYGYLIARHIMLSLNLKKASQPEKERERRRRKEIKKLAKKAARRNPTQGLSPPISSDGHDSLHSNGIEEIEEIPLENSRVPRVPMGVSDIEHFSTPSQMPPIDNNVNERNDQ